MCVEGSKLAALFLHELEYSGQQGQSDSREEILQAGMDNWSTF